MPAIPKNGPSLFLGIELGVDQLRASIVDESLELVGVECVDFDAELPEYKYAPSFYQRPTILTRSKRLSLGHRAVYLRHLGRHTRRQLRCGSKALVREQSSALFRYFVFPPRNQFFFLFRRP